VEHRALGASGLEVSALALGSWRTYERIPREQGVAVMRAAQDAGIDFLDDARYDDQTGTAPLRTGWSEVVFGELFRASGWRRDEAVVSNKLWWEFRPEQTAAEELDASLGRMGFDHVDLVYSELPDGMAVEDVVGAVTALIASGKARAWGVLNWPATAIRAAAHVCAVEGLPVPCVAQLPYSLVHRSPVEDVATIEALETSGVRVVASATLAWGALTGRGRTGRAAERPLTAAHAAAEELRGLAAELETTPACLALAFALASPLVATVLFGASRPEQIAENVGAVELVGRLGDDDLARLRAIGSAG